MNTVTPYVFICQNPTYWINTKLQQKLGTSVTKEAFSSCNSELLALSEEDLPYVALEEVANSILMPPVESKLKEVTQSKVEEETRFLLVHSLVLALSGMQRIKEKYGINLSLEIQKKISSAKFLEFAMENIEFEEE